MKTIQWYFSFLTIVIVVALLARNTKAIAAFFDGFGTSTSRIIKAPLA